MTEQLALLMVKILKIFFLKQHSASFSFINKFHFIQSWRDTQGRGLTNVMCAMQIKGSEQYKDYVDR